MALAIERPLLASCIEKAGAAVRQMTAAGQVSPALGPDGPI